MTSFIARTTLKTALGVALAGSVTASLASMADLGHAAQPDLELQASSNPATPGNFTGYAFDQCSAPSQDTMTRWMSRSPYLGVGIYISGASRGCREQPNLTSGWVHHQLHQGWHLLPITLGPQASCNPSFPRYGNDKRINPSSAGKPSYRAARKQGVNEAAKSVRRARSLGIPRGSVMYYDLEGFDASNTHCRDSAMAFLSGWDRRTRELGYKAGVYSSASSGIKSLVNARGKSGYKMPNQIWIADWDGKRNTSSRYVSTSGWKNHQRIKQYRGGHNESWGNAKINVDRDWADVGRGTVAGPVYHCGTKKHYVKVSSQSYPTVSAHSKKPYFIRAAKCLLKERAHFAGTMNGTWGRGLATAIKQFRGNHGWSKSASLGRREWTALLAAGSWRTQKYGSGSETTRNLQRALNAAMPSVDVSTKGTFWKSTKNAVKAYQRKTGLPVTGIANPITWKALKAGRH